MYGFGEGNLHILNVNEYGHYWENHEEFLAKLKIKLLYNQAIPLSGTYPKGKDINMLKMLRRHLDFHVFCSSIHNRWRLKQQPVCTEEQSKKTCYAQLYENYLAIKRNSGICNNVVKTWGSSMWIKRIQVLKDNYYMVWSRKGIQNSCHRVESRMCWLETG